MWKGGFETSASDKCKSTGESTLHASDRFVSYATVVVRPESDSNSSDVEMKEKPKAKRGAAPSPRRSQEEAAVSQRSQGLSLIHI